MATGNIKLLKYAQIKASYAQQGNYDKPITPADLKALFDENYSGNIISAFPVCSPRPLSSWNTMAYIIWEEDNNRFSFHTQGSQTQSYEVLWGFFYY